MREHDLRLLVPALAGLASCAAAAAWDAREAVALAWAAVAVVAVVAALGASARVGVRVGGRGTRSARGRRLRDVAWTVALACCLTAVVTASAALRWHHDVPPELHSPTGEGRVVVEGVVVSEARDAGRDAWTGLPRTRVAVAVSVVCTDPCATPRRARATVDVVFDGTHVPALGERVRVVGAPGTTRDPRKAATVWDASVTEVGDRQPGYVAVDVVRDRARAAAAGLPAEVRGLALGMVIGDTAAIPDDLVADMRVTGLTHLTAVSGSHFAIVTVVLAWAVRRAVRARWLRALVLAAAMGGLAAVVLPEPSVLRALTMAITVALGWWWGRPARALSALGAGLVVLLLVEPGLAGSVGLQLSAAAVVAIVTWSPRLAVVLSRWMLAAAARAVSVPLAAWLACWPLLVALQPGVGPYAVPANLIAAVAAVPVTVGGLAAAVVSLAWPQGGAALMWLAGQCARPVVWAARAFADAPGAWTQWPAAPGGVALAALVTACAVTATATDRLRGAIRLGAVIVAVVVAGLSPAWTVTTGPVADDWAVVQCDVGQGDMMLVRVDTHAAVVVDTGPPGGAGAACLDRYGVSEVALLVLTHPHADHDGAVAELAQEARIDALWASPAVRGLGHDAAVEQARGLGIPVTVVGEGAEWSDPSGSVRLTALSPPASSAEAHSSSELNDASVILWIKAGGLTALALGDLERDGQERLAASWDGPVIVDLVKVAHHGSASQSPTLARLITARGHGERGRRQLVRASGPRHDGPLRRASGRGAHHRRVWRYRPARGRHGGGSVS